MDLPEGQLHQLAKRVPDGGRLLQGVVHVQPCLVWSHLEFLPSPPPNKSGFPAVVDRRHGFPEYDEARPESSR